MKSNATRKARKPKPPNQVFAGQDFSSGDGFLTTVWGPPLWHYLHTMSFNYPVHPTAADKRNYGSFIFNLQHVLPCKHCRINLKTNFKNHPLRACHLANRDAFSRYVYELHEVINKLLGKTSGLSYCDVRERYEHFRARCTDSPNPLIKARTNKKKEKGCTEPLYGTHSKCVLKIVPQDVQAETMSIDRQCIKRKGEHASLSQGKGSDQGT